MEIQFLTYSDADAPQPSHVKGQPVVLSDLVPAEIRRRKNRSEFPLNLDSLGTFLRSRGFAQCDYAFLPAAAAWEQESEWPLRTLGTRGQARRPVREARLWGINMMNYLQAPAFFTLLKLAGVPALRRERQHPDTGGPFPLIVLGGHIWANPLPLADFYDVLVVGDGEEVLLRIAELLERMPDASREEQLAEIARLQSVYVPGYRPHTAPIRPAEIDFQDEAYLAGSSVVLDGVGAVLLSRGCPYACAFCNSSVVGGAYRAKPAAQIRAQILQLKQAGAQMVIPIAASATAYRSGGQNLLDLLDFIQTQGMAIKYLSDRPEHFSQRYLRLLAQANGKTILAVESSPKIRRQVFQKTLREETLRRAIAASIAAGIPRIQFYGIMAIPAISPGVVDFLPHGHRGEQSEDVGYLAQLAAETARQMARAGLERTNGRPYVQLDLMPFIPAIGTRLQKVAFSSYAVYAARLAELRAMLPADVAELVEIHAALDETGHLLQAFLERGDARAGSALWRAWQDGGELSPENIRQAARECGAEANLFSEFLDRSLPYEGLIEVGNGGTCRATPG